MPLLTLPLPPGMFGNGTRYQSHGRWYDGSLIRFANGTIRPIEGWQELTQNGVDPITLDGVPRSVLSWRGNDGSQSIGIGTNEKWYALWLGALYDLTPVGFTAGEVDGGAATTAYGDGAYSAGAYGYSDPAQQVYAPPAVWHQDTFGDYLVGCCVPNDGKLYYWDRTALGVGTLMDASAPTNCLGVVVTPERFVVALGANGEVRTVQWASQESLTDWTPSATNTAGDFLLEGRGSLVAGRRSKSETLLWTTDELWAMRYIGGTLVYGFERVGNNCGLVAPGAVVLADSRAYWMGQNGFFVYDGFVKPMLCEVADRVFLDMNIGQAGKITAYSLAQHGEVRWHYPSSGSDENDRYVAYNFRENHWSTGVLERTAGCDAGATNYPICAASNGKLYEHGRSDDHTDTDGTTELLPYLESGPVELGAGDDIMFIDGIVPDDQIYGNVVYTLYGAMEPAGVESIVGPFTLDGELDTRFSARQMRVRIDQVSGADTWCASPPRLRAKAAGRRGSTRSIPGGATYNGTYTYNGVVVYL